MSGDEEFGQIITEYQEECKMAMEELEGILQKMGVYLKDKESQKDEKGAFCAKMCVAMFDNMRYMIKRVPAGSQRRGLVGSVFRFLRICCCSLSVLFNRFVYSNLYFYEESKVSESLKSNLDFPGNFLAGIVFQNEKAGLSRNMEDAACSGLR